MNYMGGKGKLVGDIVPLLVDAKTIMGTEIYYEPFVGGGSIACAAPFSKRYASDIDPSLIAFYEKVKRDGTDWILEITDDQIMRAKRLKYDNPALYFFCTNFLVFRCRRTGEPRRGFYSSDGKYNDLFNPGYRSVLRDYNEIKQIEYKCSSYDRIEYTPGSVVYMDPPYDGTYGYISNIFENKFDHTRFWQFVRELSNICMVFVSEYTAPDDFVAVKSIPRKCSVRVGSCLDVVEKVYMYSGGETYKMWLNYQDAWSNTSFNLL